MKNWKNNRKTGINMLCISMFICFMVFVFAPLEIYLAQKEEFYFGGSDVVPFTVLFFGASFVAAIAALFVVGLFSFRLAQIIAVMVAFIGFGLYIQGNYIIADYGTLNGNPIDWSLYKTEGILSNGLFLVMIVVGIVLIKKVSLQKLLSVLSVISICIVLVQITTLVTLYIQKGGLDKEPIYYTTTRDEFNYSKENNMIVLLLDNFDSAVFTEILQEYKDNEYSRILQDFTYYPDTLGMYSATDFAIPQILTGEKYENDVSYGTYVNESFAASPLLNELYNDGWDCGIYSTQLMPVLEKEDMIENVEKVELTVSSHRRLAEYMYKFVGFRYLPQCLKEYCWFYPDDMKEMMRIKNADGREIFAWNNAKFYDDLEKIEVQKENNSFHFYHLEGTHAPFTMDAELNYTKETTSIQEEGKAMMKLLDSYFTELKEAGIYDNSAIIIMADHGNNDYHQNPIFLVKGMGEKHDFLISDKEVSYEDIQSILKNLKNTKSAENSVPDRTGDERIYYFYNDSHLQEDSYSEDIIEYKSSGHAKDKDALMETGVIYERW